MYKRLLASHAPLCALPGVIGNKTIHRSTGSQILKIRARHFGKKCKGEKSNSLTKSTGRGLPRPQYDYKKLVDNIDYVINIKNRNCPEIELVKDMYLNIGKIQRLGSFKAQTKYFIKTNKAVTAVLMLPARQQTIKKDIKELNQSQNLYVKMQDEMAQIPDTHSHPLAASPKLK